MTYTIVESLKVKIKSFAELANIEVDDDGKRITDWLIIDLNNEYNSVFIHEQFDTTLWEYYPTSKDTSYFRIWINGPAHCVLIYLREDIILIECPSTQIFLKELKKIINFYGGQISATMLPDVNNVCIEAYDQTPTNQTYLLHMSPPI
jgi:hypothetical protein